MQQTREELLRMAFECLRRAARLLDAAEDDLLVIKGEVVVDAKVLSEFADQRRAFLSLPV